MLHESAFRPGRLKSLWRCLPLAALLCCAQAQAGEDGSFFRNGDRWLLIGDSITNTDTYRQLMLRVLQHYHPQADIMVGNSAVNGVSADYQEKRDFKPTMVTIMLGMNNIIHRDWAYTPAPDEVTKYMEDYRKGITAKVQEYKKLGVEVVLMTPTYTDERVHSYFNTTNTRKCLEQFGVVVREIAASEGCQVVPVGEEFEAYQDTLGENQNLRPDGVHPYGLGQYQIARSLWQHFNVAGELGGKRTVRGAVPEALPVTAALAGRFMNAPAEGVTIKFSSAEPLAVKARWSLDSERGEETLNIGKEPLAWKLPASEKALSCNVGERKWLIVDLTSGGRSSLYVVDLARAKVLKPVDGVVKGTFESDKDRPEGKQVGEWSLREQADELQISGEIKDGELVATRSWPFARDGVHIYLDARPAERFANPSPDRDFYMAILGVRSNPSFAVSPLSWLGPRLQYAMNASGELTGSGYKFSFGVRGGVCDYRKFDIRTFDYYGINLHVVDTDDKPKENTEVFPAMRSQFDSNPVQGPNMLMIIDRKGKFPGNETTNLHLFGR